MSAADTFHYLFRDAGYVTEGRIELSNDTFYLNNSYKYFGNAGYWNTESWLGYTALYPNLPTYRYVLPNVGYGISGNHIGSLRMPWDSICGRHLYVGAMETYPAPDSVVVPYMGHFYTAPLTEITGGSGESIWEEAVGKLRPKQAYNNDTVYGLSFLSNTYYIGSPHAIISTDGPTYLTLGVFGINHYSGIYIDTSALYPATNPTYGTNLGLALNPWHRGYFKYLHADSLQNLANPDYAVTWKDGEFYTSPITPITATWESVGNYLQPVNGDSVKVKTLIETRSLGIIAVDTSMLGDSVFGQIISDGWVIDTLLCIIHSHGTATATFDLLWGNQWEQMVDDLSDAGDHYTVEDEGIVTKFYGFAFPTIPTDYFLWIKFYGPISFKYFSVQIKGHRGGVKWPMQGN